MSDQADGTSAFPPLKNLSGVKRLRHGIGAAAFVAIRDARDKTLSMPRLILLSLQVNIRAGHLPEPDSSGKAFLKVPVNSLQESAVTAQAQKAF